MIPIENVIAATESTPTKVAAQIMKPVDAQGAGFALDIGVDALLCTEDCLICSHCQINSSCGIDLRGFFS